MATQNYGSYPTPVSRTSHTAQWVQSVVPVPAGRAMANGDNHILVTRINAWLAGRGGTRSITLSLQGIGSASAISVANSTQAQSTGASANFLTDATSATLRATGNGSFWFGRNHKTPSNLLDSFGETWSAFGGGELTSQLVYATAPTAPRTLTGTAVGDSVTLSWLAPSSNGDSAITGYRIEYRVVGSPTWDDDLTVGNVLTHTFTVTPANYEFRVAAINAVTTARSTWSVYSNTTTVQAGYVRYLRVDAQLITQDSIVPYFDGNSTDATWSGTTNNSSSYMPNPNNVALYDAYADNNRLMQAADGEVNEYILNNNGVYATTIIQPLPIDSASPVPVGFYTVSDASNIPVLASEWVAFGGRVDAEITGIGEIKVIVTAPPNGIPGVSSPFYIASPDGADRYAQLKIAGTGIRTNTQTVTIYTGANPEQVTNKVAQSLTMPWIRNLSEAYDAGVRLSTITKGAFLNVSFQVAPEILNGFGLTPGSRFKWRDGYYRVMNVSNINRYSATIEAQLATTVADFDEAWSGRMVADFDGFWDGSKVKDFNFRPLKGT